MADREKRGDEGGYDDPKVAINRVYTRTGDAGETALAWGQRVAKDDLRVVAYGTVDELNAALGVAREALRARADQVAELAELADRLLQVQHELFNLGSILATLPDDVQPKQPRISAADVEALEADIDRLGAGLPALSSFVLPGGCPEAALLHVARTVCRRAERDCVTLARREPVDDPSLAYLNRLSDALFVWNRWVNAAAGAPEVLWEPNRASSGS